MKDPWVNPGPVGELKPYSELPWGDIGPQVTEIRKKLGLKLQETQESAAERK